MKYPCHVEIPSPKMVNNGLGPGIKAANSSRWQNWKIPAWKREEKRGGRMMTINRTQAWKPGKSTSGKPRLSPVLAA